MLIDTHCHLDFPEFDIDRNETIQRAHNNGIGYIINIGSGLEGSRRALQLSATYDFIYATCGMHPHEADRFNSKIQAELTKLSGKDKVVAIGETGLDYYAEKSASRSEISSKDDIRDKNYSKAENQKRLFISLIKLAKTLHLPLVIHNRQAFPDTLSILKKAQPVRAVVHCFSGDEEFLKECLGLGFFISYTCNITYKKAEGLRELVKITPLDRLLLETDAPFLPPEEFRGKRNEPLYVKYLAQEISRIKELNIDEVTKITTENAKSFFNLK